jgi:hypothetical protein
LHAWVYVDGDLMEAWCRVWWVSSWHSGPLLLRTSRHSVDLRGYTWKVEVVRLAVLSSRPLLCDDVSERAQYVYQAAGLLITFRTIAHDVDGVGDASIGSVDSV